MAMVIHVDRKKYCATCKWCQGDYVKSYDPRTGSMTVDNSGCLCGATNKRILPTNGACGKYEKGYQF